MAVYSAVPCAEMHDSVFEHFDIQNGMRAGVELMCDWSLRHALVGDILGNHRVYPNSAFPNPPQAISCAIRPIGRYIEFGQSCLYETALVTVDYDSKIKDLVSESLEPTAEFITLDHKLFRWSTADGDPLLEGEAPGKLTRGLNIVRTLYELSAIPAAVLTCVGCVNNATYVSSLLGLSFPAETLLFQPPTTSRTIRTNGSEGFTLTMKFSFKPDGWNKFWRGKTQSYERIFKAGGTQYDNYPLANFATLLA